MVHVRSVRSMPRWWVGAVGAAAVCLCNTQQAWRAGTNHWHAARACSTIHGNDSSSHSHTHPESPRNILCMRLITASPRHFMGHNTAAYTQKTLENVHTCTKECVLDPRGTDIGRAPSLVLSGWWQYWWMDHVSHTHAPSLLMPMCFERTCSRRSTHQGSQTQTPRRDAMHTQPPHACARLQPRPRVHTGEATAPCHAPCRDTAGSVCAAMDALDASEGAAATPHARRRHALTFVASFSVKVVDVMAMLTPLKL